MGTIKMVEKENKKANDNIHKGHRERVKRKFLDQGFTNSTPDHEIIEMLLFYSIARQDTNGIAHNLLNHFGDFSQLLEARPEEIMQVKGVSEHTAVLIKMLLPIFRRYNERKSTRETLTLDNYNDFIKYVMDMYIGESKEVARVFFFNNKKQLLGKEIINSGDVGSVSISNRKIVELVLKYGATGIVLVHNHPQGFPVVSLEDRTVTQEVKNAVRAIDAHLIDHIIVANGTYYTMRLDKEYQYLLG